jgi:hypothetical protein
VPFCDASWISFAAWRCGLGRWKKGRFGNTLSEQEQDQANAYLASLRPFPARH